MGIDATDSLGVYNIMHKDSCTNIICQESAVMGDYIVCHLYQGLGLYLIGTRLKSRHFLELQG